MADQKTHADVVEKYLREQEGSLETFKVKVLSVKYTPTSQGSRVVYRVTEEREETMWVSLDDMARMSAEMSGEDWDEMDETKRGLHRAWVIEPEEPEGPLYPDIRVQLTGTDSHPFSIIFEVTQGLKKARVPLSECAKFREEALSGDYNHVIQTAMRWVTVL